MLRHAAVILLLLICIAVVLPSAVHADGEYQITIENGELEIPEQTRSYKGNEFTFSSVGFVEPNKTINLRVEPPADNSYRILLYDRDVNRDVPKLLGGGVNFATGETSANFSTTNLAPGTYAVTVNALPSSDAVQPVIIQAYDTDISLPADVEQGDSITGNIQVNEFSAVDAPDIGRVELVVADATTGEVVERASAEKTSPSEYTVHTTVDYDTGEYQVYTGVYNNSEAEGEDLDLLSVSDRHKLTVGEQSNEKNSAGNSENISEDQDISEGQDSEGNDDKSGTSDNSPTNNTDISSEDKNTSTTELKETNSSKNSENETGDTTGQGNSSEGVIEPNEPTPPSDTSSEEVPLNGIQLIIIVLLSVAVGAKIRTRN